MIVAGTSSDVLCLVTSRILSFSLLSPQVNAARILFKLARDLIRDFAPRLITTFGAGGEMQVPD